MRRSAFQIPLGMLAVVALLAYSTDVRAQAAAPIAPERDSAPVNGWVKLCEETTGARGWPLFVYHPALDKFLVSGGEARKNAHADTEAWDAEAGRWVNLHAPGSTATAASGPCAGPGARFDRERDLPLKADQDGAMRIVRGVNPYVWEPGLFYQWALNQDDGQIYAYHFNATLRFDPRSALWSDLKAPGFSQGHGQWLIYGALAYDPVNKEIVSIGGTSDERGGTPGTWAFSPATNAWRRIRQGSPALNALNAEAGALHGALSDLLNACRNRFHVTDTTAERKVDLAAAAGSLAAGAERLVARLAAATLSGAEAQAPKAALAALRDVSAGIEAMAGKLAAGVDGATLVAGQALLEAADRVERALDAEPCGRAASPAVTCASLGKIVLFSGCRLDGYLADTWVYDCRTRTWEQRWPKLCPAPRAGHLMAWLPKSGRIVLYGAIPFSSGYGSPRGNQTPPRDLWSYDVDANEWKLLAAPAKDAPLDAFGAADGNDRLLAMGTDPKNKHARTTWSMQVDPRAPDAGSAAAGAVPGSATSVFETPAAYDQVAAPDPDAIGRLLKELPANRWTLLPQPPKSANSHPWGKTPYDTLRHQWISFGGGHSIAHFNDVAHYSLRAATWSQGYGEEYPYQNASFAAFFNQTFRDRPTVPTHVWDGTACDPVTGKAVYCVRGGTWVYDPARRAWEYPPLWGRSGGSKVNMTATPRGVVQWDASGNLHLFDVQSRTWSQLPLKGSPLGAAYGDTGGICHDARRDCLWLGHGGTMIRYDMRSGEATAGPTSDVPEGAYLRGSVYVPELDMVLSAGRQRGPDGVAGNLAYDIESGRWVGVTLPCSDDQPRINDQSYSDINLAVAYDPLLKLALFHSNKREILVSPMDKASLKTFAVRMRPPKRRNP